MTPPAQHCLCEKVCGSYLYEVIYGKFVADQSCDPTIIFSNRVCKHDTRTRPAPAAPLMEIRKLSELDGCEDVKGFYTRPHQPPASPDALEMDWGDIIKAIEAKGYTVKIRKRDAAIIRQSQQQKQGES